MIKPLIIGEAPSKNGGASKPCEGRVGERLAESAGISYDEYLTTFDRVNLIPTRQDDGHFTFDLVAAAKNAEGLWLRFAPGQVVLLLGHRVARAFTVRQEYFDKQRVAGADVYVVPHPSGLNRWWNDPQNREKMERFMRCIVQEAKFWGIQ